MKELSNKLIVINKVPRIYQDKELTRLMEVSLAPDSEISIFEEENNCAVKVILPDSSTGYIHGDEEVNLIQTAWLTGDTDFYDHPDKFSDNRTRFKKGTQFELLNLVANRNKEWVRVRLAGEKIQYMKGDVELITEESLNESIAEMIGEGKVEDDAVAEFVKEGVPESMVRSQFQKVTTMVEEYRKSPEGKRELAQSYARHILYGLLWAAGGVIATLISYSSAGSHDTYFIFWGAVGWGVYEMFRGIIGWARYSM